MDANTQLANDVHFLTAPFRFLWRSILWLLFLLFAPLLYLTVPFVLIATDPNADFGVIAFFYMVTGPFVCCFWMCIASYLVSIRQLKNKGEELHAFMPGLGARYARCFGYMLFGFFGSLIAELLFHSLFGTPDMGNPWGWALWFAAAPFGDLLSAAAASAASTACAGRRNKATTRFDRRRQGLGNTLPLVQEVP